jgi:hypothetical protein
LLFPQENRTFGISGINLCHLGAENASGVNTQILRCVKTTNLAKEFVAHNDAKCTTFVRRTMHINKRIMHSDMRHQCPLIEQSHRIVMVNFIS